MPTQQAAEPRDVARAILARRASAPVELWEMALTDSGDPKLINFELSVLADGLRRQGPQLPEPAELLAALTADSHCAQCITLARVLADIRAQETRRDR